MNDVRQLLKTKVNIETAMQRADPLMRLVMQRQLDVVCGEIEEAREEWHKLFEPQEIDQLRARVKEAELKNRIAELEREVKYYAIEIITTLKSLGWTTTKIAKAINMSREHISCIHNGKYVAGKEATEKLKKLMEVAIANNQQITEIKSQIATSDICRECKGKALAIIESAKPQS